MYLLIIIHTFKCIVNTFIRMYDIICKTIRKGDKKIMQYYQRIKDLREDMDVKQSYIAKKLNITQQQYSMYESGKREIPFHKVIEIAKIYQVSIDYIAGLTNSKQKTW